jgi:hypothetical protein
MKYQWAFAVALHQVGTIIWVGLITAVVGAAGPKL